MIDVRARAALRHILSSLDRHPRDSALQLVLRWRSLRYRLLSTHQSVFREAATVGGVLAIGAGTISAGGSHLGYWPSPGALSSCLHLEARFPDSRIEIGAGTRLNNGSTLISEGPGIRIGREVLIGPECMIFDSDFHHSDSSQRSGLLPSRAPVLIGDRVFVGARAVILKGVTVGNDAVVAAGSVVIRDVGVGEIAAGNPAKIVGSVG